MLYGNPRRYSAYAGAAVEAFCLTSKDYNQVLERYPTVRTELEKKVTALEDLFERRIKKAAGITDPVLVINSGILKKDASRKETINAYIRTKQLPDPGKSDAVSSHENWFKQLGKKILGSGTDDENLPFLYFVKR